MSLEAAGDPNSGLFREEDPRSTESVISSEIKYK